MIELTIKESVGADKVNGSAEPVKAMSPKTKTAIIEAIKRKKKKLKETDEAS